LALAFYGAPWRQFHHGFRFLASQFNGQQLIEVYLSGTTEMVVEAMFGREKKILPQILVQRITFFFVFGGALASFRSHHFFLQKNII